MTCAMEIELGAYVLQALEPEEAEGVRRHLGVCQGCRDEAHSLAFTASLLALLTPQEVEQIERLEQSDEDSSPWEATGPCTLQRESDTGGTDENRSERCE